MVERGILSDTHHSLVDHFIEVDSIFVHRNVDRILRSASVVRAEPDHNGSDGGPRGFFLSKRTKQPLQKMNSLSRRVATEASIYHINLAVGQRQRLSDREGRGKTNANIIGGRYIYYSIFMFFRVLSHRGAAE